MVYMWVYIIIYNLIYIICLSVCLSVYHSFIPEMRDVHPGTLRRWTRPYADRHGPTLTGTALRCSTRLLGVPGLARHPYDPTGLL